MTAVLHQNKIRRAGSARAAQLLAGTAAMLLVLSGCAPEPGEQGQDSGSQGAGGSAPTQTTPTETASPSPTTPQPPAPSATRETPPASSDECIVGEWLASNDFFLAGMREYGGDQIQSVTGEVVLTYSPEGSLTTDYREWEITAFEDGETVTLHRHGVDRGEYSVSDDRLSFSDSQMGTTITVSGGGMSVELATNPASYADLPFTCDASTLTMTTPEGNFPMHRR